MINNNLKEILNKQPGNKEVFIEANGIEYEIRGFSVDENKIILKNG